MQPSRIKLVRKTQYNMKLDGAKGCMRLANESYNGFI